VNRFARIDSISPAPQLALDFSASERARSSASAPRSSSMPSPSTTVLWLSGLEAAA